MPIFANLIMLGIVGVALLAFSSLGVLSPSITFFISAVTFIAFFAIAFLNTRTWLEQEHRNKIQLIKDRYEQKIRRLKYEYDTATIEKTIRDGTNTLIKNAVDYFKIENIKNEMPPSAAIQNLQLDKYGQIIELLADFSLILPDYEENCMIVQEQINHQIAIYQIDEKPFADFLQSIMSKYLLTVDKKIRERRRPQAGEKEDKFQPLASRDFQSHREYQDWLKRGNEACRLHHYKEALRLYSLAIHVHPEGDQAHYNRGIIFKQLDRNDDALKDIEAAARLGNRKARQLLTHIQFSDTQDWIFKSATEDRP